MKTLPLAWKNLRSFCGRIPRQTGGILNTGRRGNGRHSKKQPKNGSENGKSSSGNVSARKNRPAKPKSLSSKKPWKRSVSERNAN